MFRITEKPWFRKALISLVGRPLLREFTKAIKNVKQTQDTVLKNIVESCRHTAFGRDHNFGRIKTIEDYKNAVPIGNFEKHRPYVEKMFKGASDILFPGRPLFYNTTSGTTDKPKFIPVSKDYYNKAYTSISRLWLYSCLLDNPRIYDGKSISAVAVAEEGCVEDGTPYGSISGVAYKNVPKVLQSTYSTPYPIICIRDYQKKYYALMRCALEQNITIIVSPSPSNLLRFHQTVNENYDDLVKDIHDGTLKKDIADAIDPEFRASVLSTFRPNRKRANMLENMININGNNLRPKHYWPNLAMINTWKQGNFALLLPELDGFYPESTVIRAFGYQASEGRAGLVFGNDWLHSVLAIHVYHFEFIEEHARFDKNPPVLQAHEVEAGKRYYIFFSNGSGLYRYDINDIIEVVGFYEQTPLFKFIQKGEGVTSLTGEKLSEEQVIQSVNHIEKENDINLPFYLMFCDEKELCYKFFVEFPQGVSNSKKDKFCTQVDKKLKNLNPEYEIKRESKRLSKMNLCELKKNSREQLKELLVSKQMAREGQYKDVYLSNKKMLLELLNQLKLR
jgi:hypothetical protein